MVDHVKVKSKVILLGDGAVGKTSLIRRYVLDQFRDEYIQTIWTKVTKKEIKINAAGDQVVDTTMMIWDIMGQREYYREHILQFNQYKPQTKFYMGAKGAMVVCDLTRRSTLESLPLWVSSIFEEVGSIPLVFMANKADVADGYQFELEDLVHFASQYQCPAFMTSAKTGENVEIAFYKLCERMVEGLMTERMR